MKNNFWSLLIFTIGYAVIAFNGRFEMVIGAVLILCLVEYLCQELRWVAKPLRELADFANESKKER